MKIKAVRGMQDILPAQRKMQRRVEDTARRVVAAYGYEEIGLPQLEQTDLFKRSVGENTDIVSKEMYTFEDRNGDSLTIRPEGTAGCVRFAEENGLLFNQVQRFWYAGAMFRHERPQKGRYRQFDQIGLECFGMEGPDIDAELVLVGTRLWKELGLIDQITLELNSIGNPEGRMEFENDLVAYLNKYRSDLDEDSQRRLDTNPLRILDSKVEKTQELLNDAPELSSYWDDESRSHFDNLRSILDDHGVNYVVNPRIVRGLDYYNRTVFEWVTDSLGSQGAVCAGGRYDGLVGHLGGRPTPAVGFAMGIDRLSLMLAEIEEAGNDIDVYVVSQGEAARRQALTLAENLRDGMPNRAVLVHCGTGKFKAQLKKADASGAELAVILGESEVESGTVGVKSLRSSGDQVSMEQSELVSYCTAYFSKER